MFFWEGHSRLLGLQSDRDEEMQRMGQIQRKTPAFWIEYQGSRLEDEPFSGIKSQLLIVGSACQSAAVARGYQSVFLLKMRR